MVLSQAKDFIILIISCFPYHLIKLAKHAVVNFYYNNFMHDDYYHFTSHFQGKEADNNKINIAILVKHSISDQYANAKS